jgi:hypothetical protein
MISRPNGEDLTFIKKRGYCICIDTWSDGPTLAVHDENETPCVFETE